VLEMNTLGLSGAGDIVLSWAMVVRRIMPRRVRRWKGDLLICRRPAERVGFR